MLSLAIIGLAALGAVATPPSESDTALDRAIRHRLESFQGRLGLAVVDVSKGRRYGLEAEEPMYLASGVKLAFMVSVFRAIRDGLVEADEALFYGPDDIRDGAPRINKKRVGSKLPLRDVLEYMMRSSDNAASDLVVDRVGLDYVQESLLAEKLYGFTPIVRLIDVRRGFYRGLDVRADDLAPLEVRTARWTTIWDPQVRKLEELMGRPRRAFSKEALLAGYDRFYETGVNRAPMRVIAQLFEKMLEGTLVSARASEQMLELMSGARTSKNRLIKGLPRGTLVAHKTGSQYFHFCDLGVAFLPGGATPRSNPLIVTMCTDGAPVNEAEPVMAFAAREAYRWAMEARS